MRLKKKVVKRISRIGSSSPQFLVVTKKGPSCSFFGWDTKFCFFSEWNIIYLYSHWCFCVNSNAFTPPFKLIKFNINIWEDIYLIFTKILSFMAWWEKMHDCRQVCLFDQDLKFEVVDVKIGAKVDQKYALKSL